MNGSSLSVNINNKVDLPNLLKKYDKKYFSDTLKNVTVSWSDKMTLCTGKTYLRQRGSNRYCSIRLSTPILSQRTHQDTINTLLHEMIHAHLFITRGKEDGNGHGPHFKSLMRKINNLEGSRIQIFHNFLNEVDKFRIHIYQCDGPCRHKRPYYGKLKRAITRPPGPEDKWWSNHTKECGGTFHKISNESSESRPSVCVRNPRVFERKHLKTKLIEANSVRGTSEGVLVKRSINKNYVSGIGKLNIKKYILNYFKYNEGLEKSKNSLADIPNAKPINERNGVVKPPLSSYVSKMEKINVSKYMTKYNEYKKYYASTVQGKR